MQSKDQFRQMWTQQAFYIYIAIIIKTKMCFIIMNAADKATLRFMIDPTIIEKHKDAKEEKPLAKEDIDFYKERIKDLTEHLLEHGETDDSLNKQFNDYVKACISYLHTCDVNDTFQEKYTGLVHQPRSTSKDKEEAAVCNDRLVCRPPKGMSIKDFVIVKNKPAPTSFPSEELFDAHDSRFKDKRIKKKENIGIIYGKNEKVVKDNKGNLHKKKEKKTKEKTHQKACKKEKERDCEKGEV